MNILIIEDEMKTAKELKAMVERVDAHLHVVEIVSSVKSGIDRLRNLPGPQLILSDIQLSDGLSFEIFRTVQAPCPVIFCTAFDHYAIQAFEANGIDYLLKPIDDGKLSKSLQKYEQLRRLLGGTTGAIKQLDVLLDQLQLKPHKSSILVYRNEKIVPVHADEIAFIHSAGGIVQIYTKTLKTHLIQEVLDDLEHQLDPRVFFRANRQFIINRGILVMAEHYFGRRLILKLNIETPERVIVSKERAPEFLSWMES